MYHGILYSLNIYEHIHKWDLEKIKTFESEAELYKIIEELSSNKEDFMRYRDEICDEVVSKFDFKDTFKELMSFIE